MFWLFIAATTVGLGFFKLGALSVWERWPRAAGQKIGFLK